MRVLALFIFFQVLSASVSAQQVNLLGRPGGDFYTSSSSNVQVSGSPYLYDDYVPSSIFSADSAQFNVGIKFDVFKNEILANDNGRSVIIKSSLYPRITLEGNAGSIVLGNGFKVDGYDRDHYFHLLADSKDGLILKDYHIEYIESQETSYGGETIQRIQYKLSEKYFLVKDNASISLPTKKSAFVANFDDSSKEILRNFIKENRINLSNEQDLIRAVEFVISL